MIIDSHVHMYHPDLGDYAWPPKGDAYHRPLTAEMLRADAGSELTGAVLIGCSNEYELNVRLLEWMKDEPLVMACIAQLDLADPDCAAYVRRYAEYPKYRGFRIASAAALPWADRLDSVLTPGAAVELLGPWTHTAKWKDVIAAHPDTTFIIEHFGGYEFRGTPVEDEYVAFCRDMAALPNTAVKLSGFFTLCRLDPKSLDPETYRGAFDAMLSAFGAERCAYGADWPVTGTAYPPAIDVARALLGDKAEQVMYKTAKALYHI